MAKGYVPYSGPIVTRQEAKAAGSARYFTGELCQRGHLSQRKASNAACVACNAEQAAARRAADPLSKERDLQRRMAKADKIKCWKKAYNDRSKDRIAATCRAWYVANKEAATDARKRYRDANPEVGRAIYHRRRARLLAANGDHTARQIVGLLAQQRSKCPCCKVKLVKYEVDHIVPIARGGSNSIDNIQLLCMPCNSSKGAKDPIRWAQENGRLL